VDNTTSLTTDFPFSSAYTNVNAAKASHLIRMAGTRAVSSSPPSGGLGGISLNAYHSKNE